MKTTTLNTHTTCMHDSEAIFFEIPSRRLTTDLLSSSVCPQPPPQKSDFISTLLNFHSLLPVLLPFLLAGQLSASFHCALWWQELAQDEGQPLLLVTLPRMFFHVKWKLALPQHTPCLPQKPKQMALISLSYLPRPREELRSHTGLASTGCPQTTATASIQKPCWLRNANLLLVIPPLPCEMLLQKVKEPCKCPPPRSHGAGQLFWAPGRALVLCSTRVPSHRTAGITG